MSGQAFDITFNGGPIVASTDLALATDGQELADYLNGMQSRYNYTLSELAVPKADFKPSKFVVVNDNIMNVSDVTSGITAAPHEGQKWDGSWRQANVSVSGDVITLSGLQRGYRYQNDDRSYEGPDGPISLPPINRTYSPVVAGIELDYRLMPGTYIAVSFDVTQSDTGVIDFGLHMLCMNGPSEKFKIPLWLQMARGQQNTNYSRHYYQNVAVDYNGSLISPTDFDEIQITPSKNIYDEAITSESFMTLEGEGVVIPVTIGLEYTTEGLLFAYFFFKGQMSGKALMMIPDHTESKPLALVMIGESHPGSSDDSIYPGDPAPPTFSKTITIDRSADLPAGAAADTVSIGSRTAIPNVSRVPQASPDLRPTHAEIEALSSNDEIRHMSIEDVVAIFNELKKAEAEAGA
ncbi:MAG: hypothetical protein K6L60_05685 [Oceanobacter sp.]